MWDYLKKPMRAILNQIGEKDTQVIDNQYERILEAGLAVMLLINIKAGVDRSRYDRILDEQTPIWTRALATVTDLPVQAPLNQIQIVSV